MATNTVVWALQVRALVLAGLMSVTSVGYAQWTVVRLHPDGVAHSLALGVGDGEQVGYTRNGSYGDIAAVWRGSAASHTSLQGRHRNERTWATSAAGGKQYGVFQNEALNAGQACFWNGNSSTFQSLHPPSVKRHSEIHGAGGAQQVGSYRTPGGGRLAGFWSGTPESFVGLHPLGFVAAGSGGFAGDGHYQVGEAGVRQGKGVYRQRASLWSGSAESWVNLGSAGFESSGARGVGDGEVVGWASDTDYSRAVLWKIGPPWQTVMLHSAQWTGTAALDAADGHQVGSAEHNYVERAAIWSGSTDSYFDLHSQLPEGFSTSRATGIEVHDGKTYIVGHGTAAMHRRTEALLWCATMPSAASMNVLLGSAISGSLNSTFKTDDRRLGLRSGPTFGILDAAIKVSFEAQAPNQAISGFSFGVEAGDSQGQMRQMTLAVYNFALQKFETFGGGAIFPLDRAYGLHVTLNVQDYIDPITNRVKGLVSLYRNASGQAFNVGIDKVWFTFPANP